ncbi:MAG: hypothetical protein AAFQ37_10120, partial [Bacteroidota bacterium]
NPPSRSRNGTYRTGAITFEGEDMIVDIQTTRTGVRASSFRHSYENDSPANWHKTMSDAISGNYPRVELEDMKINAGLEDLSNEVDYQYRYRVIDPATSIGGMSIYNIVFADGISSPAYLNQSQRSFPIDLWQVFAGEIYEQELLINTPTGKALVETPEDIDISNQWFEYQLSFQEREGGLLLKRKFVLKDEIILPEDYLQFKEIFLQVVEADDLSLAYR